MNETSIQRIEQKLASIERQLGDLSVHLRSAFSYRISDPQSAVTKCRILLERVVRDIHEREFDATPGETMVGTLINNKEMRARIPRRMLAKMNMIREWANLGAHGDQVTSDDAEMTLLNLLEVLDWYFDTYQRPAPSMSDGFQIGRELLPDFAARLKHPLRSE